MLRYLLYFHLLLFCSLPSLASVAFSSVSLIRAGFHIYWLTSDLYSLPYKTFLCLWSGYKNNPFLALFRVIFFVISVCCITLFFHSSCLKDTLEALEPHWWKSAPPQPSLLCCWGKPAVRQSCVHWESHKHLPSSCASGQGERLGKTVTLLSVSFLATHSLSQNTPSFISSRRQ